MQSTFMSQVFDYIESDVCFDYNNYYLVKTYNTVQFFLVHSDFVA